MGEKPKRVSDVMPERNFYPDMERIESSALVGKEFELVEAQQLEGQYGVFNVAKIVLDDKEYSTAFGSKVVNDKINFIRDKLPLMAKMIEKKSKEGRVYFDLE